jgi:succinoglycan biosynthesis transport protein ExoP
VRQNLGLNDVASGIRRRWWIPIGLGLVGATIGVGAAVNVPVVYRSEATLLVGPTDGAVTYSSTLRASEDLAAFYADMARRQMVLEPVADGLGLEKSWVALRDDVSAVVPTQNLRLVTVTVLGDTQTETEQAANAIVEELVALSPAPLDGSQQEFVNTQAAGLEDSIESAQLRIDGLKTRIDELPDTIEQDTLQARVGRIEKNVGELQQTYVELVGVTPSADAGGLQVLDEATPVTSKSRIAMVRQVLVGALAGVVLGMLISWLLHRRRQRRDRAEDAEEAPVVRPQSAARNGNDAEDAEEAPVVRPQSAARNGNDGVARELVATKLPDSGDSEGAAR